MALLNKYCLFHETQSGRRQKQLTALIKLIDQWTACIDRGEIVGLLFLDLRKAFDLVDHKLLIQKYSAYKFCDPSIQFQPYSQVSNKVRFWDRP